MRSKLHHLCKTVSNLCAKCCKDFVWVCICQYPEGLNTQWIFEWARSVICNSSSARCWICRIRRLLGQRAFSKPHLSKASAAAAESKHPLPLQSQSIRFLCTTKPSLTLIWCDDVLILIFTQFDNSCSNLKYYLNSTIKISASFPHILLLKALYHRSHYYWLLKENCAAKNERWYTSKTHWTMKKYLVSLSKK